MVLKNTVKSLEQTKVVLSNDRQGEWLGRDAPSKNCLVVDTLSNHETKLYFLFLYSIFIPSERVYAAFRADHSILKNYTISFICCTRVSAPNITINLIPGIRERYMGDLHFRVQRFRREAEMKRGSGIFQSSSSSSFEGHPLQVRHKQDWAEGLSFYYPRLLHSLNQMLAVVLLSQHQV